MALAFVGRFEIMKNCGTCGNPPPIHSTTCPMKFQCPDMKPVFIGVDVASKPDKTVYHCNHDYYKLPGVSMGCVTYKCKFCDDAFEKDIS